MNSDVRKEILGYAKDEFGGEVTAHFTKLLNVQNKNSSSSDISGLFARIFQNKAIQFDQEQSNNVSQSSSDIQSSLEDYLKENNMALFGPYLAENHANSSEPITVSFDPLDDNKVSNVGYKFIPKSSQRSVANHGGIDAPANIDDYYLEEIQNVDDQYAYENPTIFVIPDDGNTNIPSTTNNGSNTNNTERDIDCRDLSEDDIIQFSMPKYQLNGNLRSAPWKRNLLDLWFISGDDISVNQANLTAILDDGTAKIWRSKQVSKENGRKKNWLNSDVTFVDTNWGEDEVNQYMIIAYKSGNDGGNVDGTVSTVVDENGVKNQLNLEVSVPMESKFESFHQLSYDRCGTLAIFKTDLGDGLHEGLAIIRADKMNFTLNAVKR